MKRLVLMMAAGAVMGAQGALVTGDLYNLDFGSNVGNASGAAVVGSAGDQWNILTGSGYVAGPTIKADGTPVNVGNYGAAAVGASGSGIWGPGSGSHALMEDYLYITDNDAAFGDTIGGIATGASMRRTIFDGNSTDLNTTQAFDLTFMGSDNNGIGFGIILKQSDGIGGFVYLNQVVPGKQWTADPTYEAGVNYVTFSDVKATSYGASGSEFEYWLYSTTAQNGTGVSVALNGYQLEAVPEPATLGLIAMFGGSVLFIRRRLTL